MELKDKISFAINQTPINNCDGSPNDDTIKAIRLLQEGHRLSDLKPVEKTALDGSVKQEKRTIHKFA